MAVLKGYYAVAETKQGSSHYYYAIYNDGKTYKVGDVEENAFIEDIVQKCSPVRIPELKNLKKN